MFERANAACLISNEMFCRLFPGRFIIECGRYGSSRRGEFRGGTSAPSVGLLRLLAILFYGSLPVVRMNASMSAVLRATGCAGCSELVRQ